jgi:hypothetical protein
MRFDTITIPHTFPVQGTDAGTPVLQREAIPFGAIMPAPTLPDDGAKTRDRQPNPQKPDRDENQPEETDDKKLPEPFKLIAGRDFAAILRYLSVENHAHLFELVQAVKEVRGVFDFRGYPDYYVETPYKFEQLGKQYEFSAFFHHTRPGARFAGKM